jgi:hypothetical protein
MMASRPASADLGRIVDQELDVLHLERRRLRGEHRGALLQVLQRRDVGIVARRAAVLLRVLDELRERLGRRRLALEAVYGHRVRVVPVLVEGCADLVHDRAGEHQVEIRKVGVVGGAEVLVTDVAPTHDRYAVVHDPGLVVHPTVEPPTAYQHLGQLPQPTRAAVERVEDPHFDVRVHVRDLEQVVLRARIDVVHQHAHPHPALGGAHDLRGNQPAGEIAVPDVVLDVERALGDLRGGGAIPEGHRVLRQQAYRRDTGLIAQPRFDHAVERSGVSGRNRVAGLHVVKPGRGGAMHEQRQDHHRAEPRHATAPRRRPGGRRAAHRHTDRHCRD